jgi:hypothetical protein
MFLITLRQSETTINLAKPQSSARAKASEQAMASKVSGSVTCGITLALAATYSP